MTEHDLEPETVLERDHRPCQVDGSAGELEYAGGDPVLEQRLINRDLPVEERGREHGESARSYR